MTSSTNAPVLSLLLALLLLTSCAGGHGSDSAREGDTLDMRYARLLRIVDYPEYTTATVTNPWDTTKILQTYVLVSKDAPDPDGAPAGVTVRVPLQRSVVYTGVHANLIDRLGALGSIAGVCEPEFIASDTIAALVASQAIADCGKAMAPNLERILMLNPDAILLSAFENSNDHNKVAHAGVPIIDCADYMEVSPLARAEWMRFYGRLYGKAAEADSLFALTERNYNAAKAAVPPSSDKPSVLFDMIYGGVWSQPCQGSTIGILIDDAHGTTPFSRYTGTGSKQLSAEEVLFTAKDADIWLIRYYGDVPRLDADNPIYTKFGAYARGRVYGCNTQGSTYFDDAAFSPHLLLEEFVRLLHSSEPDSLRYFHKID